MPSVRVLSLVALMSCAAIASAAAENRVIAFPCMKNAVDGRVLVDGVQWDEKMRQLGYSLADGAYVPYKVLRFTETKRQDDIWSDGTCSMELLPVTR